MQFVMTDGGRAAAGFKDDDAGDCVVRAIAIATDLPYKQVHETFSEWMGHDADSGSYNQDHFNARKFLISLGFKWIPLMSIGSGCKAHLKAEDLPSGRIIAKVSHHLVAVIDGVIHDNHDCSRNGTRCVYGYYIMERNHG